MIGKLAGDNKLNGLQDELPNEYKVSLNLNRYSLVGASVRGKMHVRKGTPREDAFVVYSEGDWVVVAVSDGVGSSKYSSVGASFAINDVCQNILNAIGELESPKIKKGLTQILHRKYVLTDEDLGNILKSSYGITSENLRNYAEKLSNAKREQDVLSNNSDGANEVNNQSDTPNAPNGQIPSVDSNIQELSSANSALVALSDLHCTLLVFVINIKSGTSVAGQIGDGLILGLNSENKAVPLIEPIVPEQTGQVYPITMKDWEKYWSFRNISGEVSDKYVTFYLMTDGVADDCQYGPPEDILQRWANDMNSEIRKYDISITGERLRKYLSDYEAKGSYDDRTLVVLYKLIENKAT